MKLAAMIDTAMHDAEEVRILQDLSMLKMFLEYCHEKNGSYLLKNSS